MYQPTIERVFVCDATAQNLRYNHDSSIVWFLDRWFCVWNANTVPKEGAPGQLNYVSTSSDGQTWSTPQPVFSDPGLSSNPIPCPTGTQWQPNLIVVSNRLWCFWLQWSSSDNYEGCYFSMLDSPDGKWKNQKLTWGGNIHPMIDGKAFDPFPTQNPVRLRTGRVLVPVTLMGPISAEAAAAGLTAREKRNSVIYTDDNGTTWQVSPGTVLPGLDWRQWEPTVFEQPDGSVMMFARNDLSPSKENGTVKPAETLTWSISKDGGATWSPQAFVPLQTVVSRMHVLQQENSDRYLMIHNDWLAGSKDERHNLALFFNRGGGMDFVAGTGLTDTDIRACYAQMAFHGQSLLASYSEQGSSNLKVVRVTPLPDPNQLYIYPRANIPASPRFAVTNDAISLAGGLALKCRTVPNVSPAGLSCAAWIKPINFVNVALFDNRSSAGGFVWGYSSWLNVYLVDPAISITSHLPIKFGRTNYFGLTLDYVNGYATFYVNGEHETVTFTPGTRSMASASATVAGPNGVSNLSQFEGDLYAFAFYGTNRLSDTEHGSLFQTQSVALPQTPPSLLLAPADAPALARDFVLPTNNLPIAPESVQTVQSDGKTLIRFTGATSAGVELGANERAYGDIADLEFAFRLESGDGQTLCTVGDANQPARVLVSGTNILLCANNQTIPCGRATPGVWQRLALKTGKTVTRVTLDSNPPAEIQHTPEATWIYLGDGYRPDSPTNYAVFSIDVQSVRSRVLPAEVFLHESFITGTTSANGEYGIGILRDVSPSAAGGTIVGFSAGSPWSVNTALPLVSASGLSSAGVTGAGGAVVFRGNSETAYSTRGAMRAINAYTPPANLFFSGTLSTSLIDVDALSFIAFTQDLGSTDATALRVLGKEANPGGYDFDGVAFGFKGSGTGMDLVIRYRGTGGSYVDTILVDNVATNTAYTVSGQINWNVSWLNDSLLVGVNGTPFGSLTGQLGTGSNINRAILTQRNFGSGLADAVTLDELRLWAAP